MRQSKTKGYKMENGIPGAWRQLPELGQKTALLGLATLIKLAAHAAEPSGESASFILQGSVKALSCLGIDDDVIDRAIDIAIWGISEEEAIDYRVEANRQSVFDAAERILDGDI
jgi:hypothetical protein